MTAVEEPAIASPVAAAAGPETVGALMLTAPKTVQAGVTVAEVRSWFSDPKVHLLLLTCDGILVGTLLRSDLPAGVPAAAPARALSTLIGRTASPSELIGDVEERLTACDRRLAVVDPTGRLVGLLAQKRRRDGFCSDDGVAARAAVSQPATGAGAPLQ